MRTLIKSRTYQASDYVRVVLRAGQLNFLRLQVILWISKWYCKSERFHSLTACKKSKDFVEEYANDFTSRVLSAIGWIWGLSCAHVFLQMYYGIFGMWCLLISQSRVLYGVSPVVSSVCWRFFVPWVCIAMVAIASAVVIVPSSKTGWWLWCTFPSTGQTHQLNLFRMTLGKSIIRSGLFVYWCHTWNELDWKTLAPRHTWIPSQ